MDQQNESGLIIQSFLEILFRLGKFKDSHSNVDLFKWANSDYISKGAVIENNTKQPLEICKCVNSRYCTLCLWLRPPENQSLRD